MRVATCMCVCERDKTTQYFSLQLHHGEVNDKQCFAKLLRHHIQVKIQLVQLSLFY